MFSGALMDHAPRVSYRFIPSQPGGMVGEAMSNVDPPTAGWTETHAYVLPHVERHDQHDHAEEGCGHVQSCCCPSVFRCSSVSAVPPVATTLVSPAWCAAMASV